MLEKHRLISDCLINGEAAAGLHRSCGVLVGVWIRGAAWAAAPAIRVAWHTEIRVAVVHAFRRRDFHSGNYPEAVAHCAAAAGTAGL